jgi:hypothetical protein
MRASLIIILMSLIVSNTYAQSYEGTIGYNFYIWVDLSTPRANGEISGTYFYKNKYIPISLEGKKIKNKIDLTEHNKSNIITGHFTLIDNGDSLIGKWKNTKGTVIYDVLLYKTNPIYKPQGIIDVGYTTIDSSDDAYITTSTKSLNFARKNIYSYNEGTWTEGGAYPTGESTSYTLIPNDSTGILEGLNIWNEIDENKVIELKKIINQHIQHCFDDTRKNMTDSAWIQIIEGTGRFSIDSTFTLDSVFTWKDNGSQELNSYYYIDERGLHFYYYDYFHFPHIALAYDLSCDFIIDFNELKKYLSKKSVLMRFMDK